MNQRWQDGAAPFDGHCLATDDLFTVADLRLLLDVVVPDLEGHFASQPLYAFDDWHQHDGYVSERRMIDWRTLAALTRSADGLIASRQGDTDVHRSFYPDNLAFLLRYDIPDEESGLETGFAGTFDLSASPATIARIAALVPLHLRARFTIEPSKAYFDRTYAG